VTETKLMTAPSLIHTANVFLPGCLGPVKREVVLAEDHQELVDRLEHATNECDQLKAENEALRKALTYIRDTSDDWHVCEKAADALADGASGDIPDFTPGTGNKARRRAEALGIDYDAAMGKGEQP
jgi:hypothetical protein